MATLATLRKRINKEAGMGWRQFTTSSDGIVDGSTLISTDLKDFRDGSLEDKYVIITDSTDTGMELEIRKVENNWSPSGTLKPYRNFTGMIYDNWTCELSDFDPDDIEDAVNQFLRDSYPRCSKQIMDNNSLIGGNILLSALLDQWTLSTVPDYHTVSLATCTKETTERLFGASCLKMATAAGTCYLSSDTFSVLRKVENSTITFKRWCKCSVASTARLYITTVTQGGTTATTNGSYHSGGGEWELLEVEASVPDDLAEVRLGMQTATANTAYFDKGHCGAKNVEYLLPSQIDNVYAVYQANDWYSFETKDWSRLDFEVFNKEGTKWIRIEDASDGKKIELRGYGKFDELTVDTSSITLPQQWEKALVFGVVSILLRAYAGRIASQDKAMMLQLSDRYDKMSKMESIDMRLGTQQIRKWV